MKYYSEIDGLRALAILLVIFFHFKIELFENGFIGVDIFFTISGFLMTKIIVEDGCFSFIDFYKRRFYRIIPSLFTVVVITQVFSIFLLNPYYINELLYSAIFSVFSVVNFYFWSVDGYFAISSEFKPLLHLWTLSLEEQFYLLFPFLLIALNKKVFAISIFLIITSFISFYTLNILSFDYDKDSTAFFLLPFRLYQFAIGSLGYYFIKKNYLKFLTKTFRNISCVLAMVSVFIISTNVLNYNINQLSIGLICSISTIILILLSPNTFFSFILNNFLMRYLGKISYSLYLVHWPIWVLSGELEIEFVRIIFAILLTLILGILLFHTVEKKMRINRKNEIR